MSLNIYRLPNGTTMQLTKAHKDQSYPTATLVAETKATRPQSQRQVEAKPQPQPEPEPKIDREPDIDVEDEAISLAANKTVAAMLAWVGGSRERAARALAAETTVREVPRSTLVEALQDVIGS